MQPTPHDRVPAGLPSAADPQRRVGLVHQLWERIEARDWAGLRTLLHPQATMHWVASGEHFGDADAIVRVQAVYPEGWTIRILDVTARLDGSVHANVEVIHPPARHFASSVFHFDGEHRIVHIAETWATVETPPAWRSAEALGAYRRDFSPMSAQDTP